MIANFFKKTKPIHAIFISVLFFVFYIASIFLIEKPSFSFLLLVQKIGFLLIFLVLFFLIRFINRKNYLSGQDSYLLLTLTLLFGMFPQTMIVDEVFISHFLLLFAFRRVYSIQSLKNVKQKIFDSAFWIGVASLFYIWSSLFMLLPLIAIYIHNRQEIRNFLISIVGFIAPLFLVFTYFFMIDNTGGFLEMLVFEYSLSLVNFSPLRHLVPILFMSAFSLGAIGIVRIKIKALANDIKPSWKLLIGHYLIAVYIILMAPDKNGSSFIFAFIPLAIFTANLLQLINSKLVKEVIVYCFCAVALSVYFL